MKNEYLFSTDERKETIENYKPEGVEAKIISLENTDLWVAKYYLPSDNEESAKKLSDIHTYMGTFSPTVITCESSAYFNRILYPKVNEMERKLRKFLYITTSLSDNKIAKSSIKKIEDMDIGSIFSLLFIDKKFITNLKTRVNANGDYSGKDQYSKAEILMYIDAIAEHTLWDEIVEDKMVSTLRARFRDVHKYRNDVMHAHDISKEIYGKALYLFKQVNSELDDAIQTILAPHDDKDIKSDRNVGQSLLTALTAIDYSNTYEKYESIRNPNIEGMVKSLQSFAEYIGSISTFNSNFMQGVEAINRVLDSLRQTSDSQISREMNNDERSSNSSYLNDIDKTNIESNDDDEHE